jgi:hypothetical protein
MKSKHKVIPSQSYIATLSHSESYPPEIIDITDDLEQSKVFRRYFSHIKVDTTDFQIAVLPFLNAHWHENKEKLITTIRAQSSLFTPTIYRECIETVKNYLNGRDFTAPGRFKTSSYFWGGVKFASISQELKDLNRELDSLNDSIVCKYDNPSDNSWSATLQWVLDQTKSKVSTLASYTLEHPSQAIVTLLYGQTALATAFPATMSLSSLTGTNGFALTGEAIGDESGWPVSTAGDINGDGIADLVVGAHHATVGSNSYYAGKSYVIFGKSSGWTSPISLSSLTGTNGFVLSGENEGDESGFSVSTAGDINGDGIADLVVGAPHTYGGDYLYAGKSYVIFGKRSRTSPMPLSSLNGANGFALMGEAAGDESGTSVSTAGDINGDGIADLVVGAPQYYYNGAGKSYVIFGKRSGWTDSLILLSSLTGSNGFVLTGEVAGDNSGASVSSAGDINGDGIADLVVGAPGANNKNGKSYVIFGKRSGWTSPISLSSLNGTNGFMLMGEATGYSGTSVSSAGDINGDGIADLVVGAWEANKSYVIFGKRSGWTSPISLSSLNGTNGFMLTGEAAGDQSGGFVSSAGDINGDGIADLVIGAREANTGVDGWGAGKSYVIFGQPKTYSWASSISLSSLNGNNGFVLTGETEGDNSGSFVSTAGDINGDGIADVVVGAPEANSGEGESYVIFGDSQPILSINNLVINQGQTILFGETNLNATYTTFTIRNRYALTYTISGLLNGQFAYTYSPSNSILSFTQNSISNSLVQFTHDGSTTAPTYQVTASGNILTAPTAAVTVSFYKTPVVNIRLLIFQFQRNRYVAQLGLVKDYIVLPLQVIPLAIPMVIL